MSSKGCVLVTGGAGYIGSHTSIEVLNAGFDVVIIDNFVNASEECMCQMQDILGQKIPTYHLDLIDDKALRQVFDKHNITHVMHFAGLKAVGESCTEPLRYYSNNLISTLTLLKVMKEFKVHKFIFSSSATVYGYPQYLPIDEKHPIGGCTNPYGKTKYFIEEMLFDLAKAEEEWKIVIFRYFNPVGAHHSGRIGEDPNGPPNNLMPYMSQVAVRKLPHLKIYGSDYDTPDGTGVRDYIHVVDLAKGHVAGLKKINDINGYKVYNLGTGHGYSVMDMIQALSKASGKEIPYVVEGRREGDVASCYADVSLAEKELGWKAERNLDDMCTDLWKWQSQNPEGFSKPFIPVNRR